MIRALVIGAILLVLVIGVAIGFFNAQPVSFNYLAGTLQVPLIALVVGELFLVGAATALLAQLK